MQHVLYDILDVTPLPNLRRALPQLSAEELKKKVIIAARLSYKWDQKTIIPQQAREFECDYDVACFQLLPGGKWMVVAKCDTTLELHEMTSEPPEVVIVDRTLCYEDWYSNSFFMVDLCLSVSQSGEILAVLHFVDYSDENLE